MLEVWANFNLVPKLPQKPEHVPDLHPKFYMSIDWIVPQDGGFSYNGDIADVANRRGVPLNGRSWLEIKIQKGAVVICEWFPRKKSPLCKWGYPIGIRISAWGFAHQGPGNTTGSNSRVTTGCNSTEVLPIFQRKKPYHQDPVCNTLLCSTFHCMQYMTVSIFLARMLLKIQRKMSHLFSECNIIYT